MRAGVHERSDDAVFTADDKGAVRPDVVHLEVAGVWNVLLAAGPLPDLWPEVLDLGLVKGGVRVTAESEVLITQKLVALGRKAWVLCAAFCGEQLRDGRARGAGVTWR